MNTQCPECKAEQEIPEVYANKQVKCSKCCKTFTASEYKKHNPKTVLHSDKTKNKQKTPIFWSPGVYLQMTGCLGIIASLLFNFGYWKSLSYEAACNHVWRGNTSYSEAEVFLIETVIFGITFVGILLSIILIALGSLVKKFQKK